MHQQRRVAHRECRCEQRTGCKDETLLGSGEEPVAASTPEHNPGASVLAWPWDTQTGTRWSALLAPSGRVLPITGKWPTTMLAGGCVVLLSQLAFRARGHLQSKIRDRRPGRQLFLHRIERWPGTDLLLLASAKHLPYSPEFSAG